MSRRLADSGTVPTTGPEAGALWVTVSTGTVGPPWEGWVRPLPAYVGLTEHSTEPGLQPPSCAGSLVAGWLGIRAGGGCAVTLQHLRHGRGPGLLLGPAVLVTILVTVLQEQSDRGIQEL